MAKFKHTKKFVSRGNQFTAPVCGNCVYDYKDGTCKAFPDGIPDEILSGKNKHRKPLLGQDNNLTYEPKE